MSNPDTFLTPGATTLAKHLHQISYSLIAGTSPYLIDEESEMPDVICMGIIALFFVVSGKLVRIPERSGGA